MKEEKPKCFTEEELNQLSNLAESTTRYSMRENGVKEQAGDSAKNPRKTKLISPFYVPSVMIN